VTTGILPWNFPFFLIARKLAPALITGNTIVIKPSEFTPNNAIAFAEIVHQVGLPKGVFNLVLGRGAGRQPGGDGQHDRQRGGGRKSWPLRRKISPKCASSSAAKRLPL
jgi:acyl-CoA reductase-like NAD-dependent aldehyde dehydrogenase